MMMMMMQPLIPHQKIPYITLKDVCAMCGVMMELSKGIPKGSKGTNIRNGIILYIKPKSYHSKEKKGRKEEKMRRGERTGKEKGLDGS